MINSGLDTAVDISSRTLVPMFQALLSLHPKVPRRNPLVAVVPR